MALLSKQFGIFIAFMAKKIDDSRRGRSPARRSDRSLDRSREDKKRRERRLSGSGSSDISKRRRRSASRERDGKQYDFPYNKPAPGNMGWFTVELQDELYALCQELDGLRKRVDKIANTIKEESVKRVEFVMMDKLKHAIQDPLSEITAKKTTVASLQQARKGKEAEPNIARMTMEMTILKKQLEEVRNIRYDITSFKESITNIKTPAMRQFMSPRQLLPNGKNPTKKMTLIPNGGAPSSVRKKIRQHKDT
ncbi:hypothetical protein CBR_g26131 [Chara braunii]|uniref:Uncharacterized protein n=1 Tax=Chara braunii TaxID=69332 RepID=A0A388JW15_CHABU|nr:hypothetical protein CBR_g26131 [Chara braunii]|eukprot:GBG61968.1 hypothetical protein CBR_g26131 [Chara braunii]